MNTLPQSSTLNQFNKMRFQILALLLFTTTFLSAQTPRFAKHPVKETGAFLYIPKEPTWEISYSEDSSKIYTTTVESGVTTYGAIIVQFPTEMAFANNDEKNGLLTSYMSFLNETAFQLTQTVDFGLGHTMESNPDAVGVIQYGETAEGMQYATKGWVDKKFLAVLFIAYTGDLNYNYQELFLNGFRFPDSK